MRDAREYVEPGDLVGVHTKYKITPAVAKKWTHNDTFQYFRIRPANHVIDRSWTTYSTLEEYFNNYWGTYPSYIRNNISIRVVSINRSHLTNEEQEYYDKLMEVHGQAFSKT